MGERLPSYVHLLAFIASVRLHRQHSRHKRPHLLQRGKQRGLAGGDMFDLPMKRRRGKCSAFAQLHHERPMGRERRGKGRANDILLSFTAHYATRVRQGDQKSPHEVRIKFSESSEELLVIKHGES